ncbi:MAG: hypothetical protein GY830_09460 [Bacteroidetes bacterium]|nr:hypothetical protein [Bacteroidota bacterium]
MKYFLGKVLLITALLNFRNVYCFAKDNIKAKEATSKKKLSSDNNSSSQLQEFSKLHISGFAKVVVEYSKNYSLKIEADEKIKRQLDINNQKGELSISTDFRNIGKHSINSYNIKQSKQGLIAQKQNIEALLSIIETDENNYLVHNGNIYKTKAKKLQDLITIYIKTPDIQHIVLQGNIKLIIKQTLKEKESQNINKDLKENDQNVNHLEKENIKIPKRDLKIESDLKSTIEIIDLKLNNFTINLNGNSKLNIHNLNADNLDLTSNGYTNININTLDIEESVNLNIKESSTLNIKEIKAKHLNSIFEDNSNSEINKIILKEKANLFCNTHSKTKINKLETMYFDLKINDNAKIKIKDGKTIYKSVINAHGNSYIDLSEIEIKEVDLYATGTGKANLKILDKLTKKVKNKEYQLKIIGEPKIIDNETKKIKKKKRKKKKKTKKRK